MKISTKIVVTMLMFVILVGAIGLLAFNNLSQIEAKLRFLEVADGLMNSILEVRRAEKNYFLYGDPRSLEEAAHFLDEAAMGLSRLSDHEGTELSPAGIEAVHESLGRYRGSIERLRAGKSAGAEEELRATGRKLLELTSRMADQEKHHAEYLIHVSKRVMLISFAVLFALGLFGAYYVGQRIVRPLAELERTTRRISSGDFSLVPGPFSHDEIGSLMLAFNTMVEHIQERTEQLAQARKTAALGTLTAGVAHELNNPLNNITITAETLVEDFSHLPEEKKLTLIEDVAHQADRARDIVRNLLTFAREREPHMEPCPLSRLLQDSLRYVAHHAELAKVELTADLPPASFFMKADPKQLQQVFVNLLMNAIQAMPKGGTCGVAARVPANGEGCVEVSVSDTGEGIAPEALPRIFDPFFTTKELGTGLGLAVTYGIVNKHRGHVSVQSKLGHGSRFIVSLPLIEGKGCEGI